MFQQPWGWGAVLAIHHVGQHSPHCEKPLWGCADVAESKLIGKNFLDDERSDSSRQLRAHLHGAQTERDDLGG